MATDVDSLFEADVDELFEADEPAAPAAPPRALTVAEGGDPSQLAPKPADTAPSGGIFDRVVRAADTAAANLPLIGPAIRAGGPYVSAALDEVNPFTESKDYADRVEENRRYAQGLYSPTLSAAASIGPGMALGAMDRLADGGMNLVQSLDEANPQSVEDYLEAGKNAAIMTAIPDVVSEAGRTVGSSLELLKPYAGHLKRAANSMASRAVGLNKSKLNNLPLDAPQTIGATLNEAVAWVPDPKDPTRLIPEPVIGGKSLTQGLDTAETIAPKLQQVRREAGQSMGDVLKTADAATGGSGAEIRSVVDNRKALDAQERVKEGLRRRALEARIGANASMGRGKLEALEAAASKNLDTRAANADVASQTHLAQVQDLVGGAKDDVARLEQETLAPEGSLKYRVQPEIQSRVGEAPDVPVADPLALPPEARGPVAAKTAADQFGPLDTSRPETFAAAGDGADVLTKRYTEDALGPTAPPADPRSFRGELGFDGNAFVDRAEKELLPALSDPALSGLKAKTERLLKAYRNRANNGMSFSEGNKMKSVLQSTIRKFQDAKADQRVKLDLQRMIDDALEEQLSTVVGDDGFRQYVKSKADYGAFSEATKANNDLIRKEAGNMPFGLMETTGAGAIGNWLGDKVGHGTTAAILGATAPTAIRQARLRGPATMAASLTSKARALEALDPSKFTPDTATSQSLAKAIGPERVKEFMAWLEAQAPQKLNKWLDKDGDEK